MADSTVSELSMTASWKSEPSFRGTFSILSACLSTLAICAWKAVHTDVPLRRSTLEPISAKIGWMIVSLLMPEIIFFIAYYQNVEAKSLLEFAYQRLDLPPRPEPWYRKLFSRRKPDTEEGDKQSLSKDTRKYSRTHPWTLVHAFYISMGGFVFDVSPTEDSETKEEAFVPSFTSRLVLTSEGLRVLMEHEPDLIPDVPVEFITDQSKTDELAKVILLLQVGWFSVTCLSRLIQKLPLSLLEVSTIAHAACTMCTYVLWWDKPYIVTEPTVIRDPRARKTCALMAMRSQRWKWYDECEPETSFIQRHPPEAEIECVRPSEETGEAIIKPGQCLYGTPFGPLSSDKAPKQEQSPRRLPYLFGDPSTFPWYVRPRAPHDAVALSAEDVMRWKLAYEAEKEYQWPLDDTLKTYLDSISSLPPSGFLAAAHGRYFTQLKYLPFAFVTVFYGAPHLLAWNGQFPTPIEHLLWRISSVVVTSSAIVAILVFQVVPRQAKTHVGFALPFAINLQLYTVCSIFILVEAFRQLWFLPPEAYQIASWSNYLPHFS